MNVFLQLLMLVLLVCAMTLAVYNTIKRRQRVALAALGDTLDDGCAGTAAFASLQPAGRGYAQSSEFAIV